MNFDLGYFRLGHLIKLLEDNNDVMLEYGFSHPHSFRGYYEDLAFELTEKPQSAIDALAVVKPCLSRTFKDYQGGDFKMYNESSVWFAYEGSGGGQQIGEMLMHLLMVNP